MNLILLSEKGLSQKPELFFFDTLMWDDVANISLEPRSYGPITQRLTRMAQQHAEGRLVSVLEGGYDLPNLGSAVAAHISALLDSFDDPAGV